MINNANSDTASFGGTAGTVTLGEAITAGGLTFTTTGYTVTASTLTLSGTPVITADTDIDVTIASILAGSDEITKVGAGTLTLTGTNTYTGSTTVAAGTLELNGTPSWQTAGSRAGLAVTIDSGAKLTTLESHQFGWTSNMADITVESGGVLEIGADQFMGNLVLNGSGSIAGTTANYIAPRGNLTANPSGGNVATIGTRISLASADNTPSGYNGGVHTFTIGDDATSVDDLTIGACRSRSSLDPPGRLSRYPAVGPRKRS